MVTLNVGTKEILVIDITDKLGEITDLATTNVDFRILTEDEAVQLNWTPVSQKEGMRVYPMIDTTVGTWLEGTYKLYLRPAVAPESPILGPIEFGLT